MNNDELKDCWAVSIKGHEFDLSEWVRQFDPPHEPTVRAMPDGTTLLFSKKFDGLPDVTAVKETADQLISVLNGVMSVAVGSQPIEFDGVSQFDENGERKRTVIMAVGCATFRFGGRAIVTSIGPDGKPVPPSPPTPSPAQLLAERAERTPEIAKMLYQLSKSDSWGEIYKAFEHAERICGNERKLKVLFGSNGANYKNARATANHHRHADVHCPNPPSTIAEAKSLARQAVMFALGTE